MKYSTIILILICASQINAQLLVKQSNGRVSIGHLEDPLDELHVKGDIRIVADGDNDVAAFRVIDKSNVKIFELRAASDATESPITLQTYQSKPLQLISSQIQLRSTSNSDPEFTYRNGQLGLGTDNPQSLLHLNGHTRVNTPYRIEWHNGSYSSAYLQQQNGHFFVQNNDDDGDIYIRSDRDVKISAFDQVNDVYKNHIVVKNDGKIGIGTDSPVHELHLAGDLGITGGIYGISDIRVKKNTIDMENAMDIIKNLRPVEYDYKTEEFIHLNLPQNHQYGLIAQEVESVLPDIVTENGHLTDNADSDLLKGINYNQLIPLLIKAIQEQDIQISKLTAQLEISNTSHN